MVATTPVIHVGESPEVFANYYRRCLAILERLGAQLAALHQLGYAFVDIGPANVLIDDDDTVRLVDFEAAQRVDHPLGVLGTPGYQPPESRIPAGRARTDPRHVDAYGLAAIAQLLVFPNHEVAQRSPETLDHLRADLSDLAPLPEQLWRRVVRFRPDTTSRQLPSPDAVREAPIEALRWLRDRTAEALHGMADPAHPRRVYPTTPDGHLSNTRCVAYGTAGVLHALRLAGREVDTAVVTRLRDDSLRNRRKTPPGLLFGNAGIAWVLADLGEHDAAATLLTEATGHRLTRTASWGGGAAGVAMTHLAFYCRTGDRGHLAQAHRLLDELPDGDALTPLLRSGQPLRAGARQARRRVGALLPRRTDRRTRTARARHPPATRGTGARGAEPRRRVGVPDVQVRSTQHALPGLRCSGLRPRAGPLPHASPGPRTGGDATALPAHGEHPDHRGPGALLRTVRSRSGPCRSGRLTARARRATRRTHPPHRAVQARSAPSQRCPLAGEPRLPAERGPVDGIRRRPAGTAPRAHRDHRSAFHARPVSR